MPAGQEGRAERRGLERFRLERVLGAGGMGEVWLATDLSLGRSVAIKSVPGKLAAAARERSYDEARAMARLSHPNIAVVHEVDLGDPAYIVMEYLAGGTLRAWQAGKPWRDIVEAYLVAGRGLAAAHHANLAHLDFKPDNVLLAADGTIKVVDFGLAASTDAEGRKGGGSTVAYSPPEQLLGQMIGPSSDQFAFCCALWEATTGTRPYERTAEMRQKVADVTKTVTRTRSAETGDTLPDAWPLIMLRSQEIISGALPRTAPPLPRRIVKVLARGLAADPTQRYASIEDLLAALRRALDTRGAPRWLIVVGVAAALAVVGAIAVIARPPPKVESIARAAPFVRTTRPLLVDQSARDQFVRASRDGAFIAMPGPNGRRLELVDQALTQIGELAIPDGLALEAFAPVAPIKTAAEATHDVIVLGRRFDRWETWRLSSGAPAVMLGTLPAGAIARSSTSVEVPQIESWGAGALVLGSSALYELREGSDAIARRAFPPGSWRTSLRVSDRGDVAWLEGDSYVSRQIVIASGDAAPVPLALPSCDRVNAFDWLDDHRLVVYARCGTRDAQLVVELDAAWRVVRLADLGDTGGDVFAAWVTATGIEEVEIRRATSIRTGPLDGPLHVVSGPLLQDALPFAWLDANTLAVTIMPGHRRQLASVDLASGSVAHLLDLDGDVLAYDRERAVVQRYDGCDVELVDGTGIVLRRGLDCQAHPSPVCTTGRQPTCVLVELEGGRQVIRRLSATALDSGDTIASLPSPPPDSDPVFPGLSADGARLALPRGAAGFAIVDVATGTVTEIADPEVARWQFASWMPDGSVIVTVKPLGPGPATLRVIAPSGESRTLAPLGAAFGSPRVSPDGRTLAVADLELSFAFQLANLPP